MTQSPQQPSGGQHMPNGRPRPGAPTVAPGAPSFQTQPRYVDYGNPRAYDTSMRPASGLTAARYAPAQIQQPSQALPSSAWGTQTRRVQEVSQVAHKAPTTSILTWIALAVLGFALIAVLGLSLLQFVVFSSANPVWWPVTAFLALLSLLVIAGVILLADRWDPQPLPLLLIAVFWGGAVAYGLALVFNTLNGMVFFALTGDEGLADRLMGVISAPLVEETGKGLGLLVLMLLARRYFNGPLDGLIYGALIGGGFAFSENILYYNRFLELGGGEAVALTFVFRGILSIFGHAMYASFTGIIVGFVVRKWGSLLGFLVFLPALIPGMLFHATWNFFAGSPSTIVMIAMFAVEAVLSFLWLCLIGLLVWDESRLTRVRLGDYANLGWLTHEEVDMLATWTGRREGKRWAAQIGAKPVMKTFIRESADLASIRQRLLADGANPKVVGIEQQLLTRLTENRRELLSHVR